MFHNHHYRITRFLVAMGLFGVLGAVALRAQDAPKPEPAVQPKIEQCGASSPLECGARDTPAPALPPDLIIDYFQAKAEVAEAQLACAQCQAAAKHLNEAASKIQAFCPVLLDAKGKPMCLPPPPPVPAKETSHAK